MIYVKIHKNNESFVTAVCDEELLNKIFREGKLLLDVNEHFYKGNLKDAVNLNLVGKKSIHLALKLKLISKECIINIQGVPHAQSIIF